MDSSNPATSNNLSTKLSKEERRKAKDLSAARMAGTALPETDTATGKVINPHIPDWMAKPSWWQDTGSGPSLKHQKAPSRYDYNADPKKLDQKFERGLTSKAAKTYRKGACENCGAMTHKKKDCLERPRKVGAKFTGKDIRPDEIVDHEGKVRGVGSAWDEKRDRWSGYNPADHKRVVLEHEALEEARKALREEELDKGTSMNGLKQVAKAGKSKKQIEDDDDFGSSDESAEEDENKYADGADVAGQKLDTKNRVTVRNLRIREDTAKYLRNLDTESAYYDPKSRSMREAPNANINPEDAVFAGENFDRMSGSARDVDKLQLFAWQSESRGQDVHVNTMPTQASLVHSQFLTKKEKLKDTSAKGMLDRYGGAEHLQKPPKELLLGQSESYVEYHPGTGQLVRGTERAKAVSKYVEDLCPGNHTSVWGSYWNDGAWGFGCCHSTIRGSYCVGETGRKQVENSRFDTNNPAPVARQIEAPVEPQESVFEERERKRKAMEETGDERGAKSTKTNGDPDAAEMEAYRKKRAEWEDPLKAVGDELLPI